MWMDEPIRVPAQMASAELTPPVVKPMNLAIQPVRVENPAATAMPPPAPAPALPQGPVPAPEAVPAAEPRRHSVVKILEMTENLDAELREQLLRRFLQE